MEEKKMSLMNKIDFAVVFSVKKANPNGDPLNGNRPRIDYDGYGEVSDVCLKRKLRNRLQNLGQAIFVQSDDNRNDEHRSLKDRFDKNDRIKAAKGDRQKQAQIACETWYDVRAFGQVFAFGKTDDENSVSIGIRGPVTIQNAVSIEPVDVSSMQITKTVNLETGKDPDKKAPDTMGMKHRVDFGVYVTYGSINCQLAEKTGFSELDSKALLEALKSMFMDDVSSARPDGSIEVLKVIWWKHNNKSGQYSSAKVHRSLVVQKTSSSSLQDYEIKINKLEGLCVEEYEGL